MKRKIVYFTSSRAEYGVMRSVLKVIDHDPKLSLSLIVTGAHLNPKYGRTIDEIRKDGFHISAKFNMDTGRGNGFAMARSFGDCVARVADVLRRVKPDILILQADRAETLAAAIAASYLNVPIVHMSGGDVTSGGSIDDAIRHATSKFAHIHLASTRASARRLTRLMEEPWRVHYVGNPGVDLRREKYTSASAIAERLSLDLKKPVLVVIYHPVKAELDMTERNTEEVMEAIKRLKMQTVVLYPNQDPGSDIVIRVIRKYSKLDFVRVIKSLRRDDFIGLLRVANAIVGNSSGALIEAPSIKLPAVNVGPRQQDRERSNNVIDVGYDRNKIAAAIRKAVSDVDFRRRIGRTPYAKVGTDKRIVSILRNLRLDRRLLLKKCYEGEVANFR